MPVGAGQHGAVQWEVWLCPACRSAAVGRATLTGAVAMPGNILNLLNRTQDQIMGNADKSKGKAEVSHKELVVQCPTLGLNNYVTRSKLPKLSKPQLPSCM